MLLIIVVIIICSFIIGFLLGMQTTVWRLNENGWHLEDDGHGKLNVVKRIEYKD